MTDLATAVAETVATGGQQDNPWFTVEQAAEYARYSYEHMRRLCVAYQRNDTHGLRCTQRGAGGHYRIHRDDLDRWLAGQPPARGPRKLAAR